MKTTAVTLAAVLVTAACRASEPVAAETRTPGPAALHIALPPGATAARFKGTLAADKDAEFVIGEDKGALLLTQVICEKDDPLISVHRSDTGAALPDEHPVPAHWIGRLPDTLGYLIVVHKTGEATPFTLTVEVPRRLIFDNSGTPIDARVSLPAHGETAYLVPPSTWITARLTAGPKDAYMTLTALDDGQQMLPAAANGRTFSGAAKNTADHVVLRLNQGSEAGELAIQIQRK